MGPRQMTASSLGKKYPIDINFTDCMTGGMMRFSLTKGASEAPINMGMLGP
jgi:hypothetical protein